MRADRHRARRAPPRWADAGPRGTCVAPDPDRACACGRPGLRARRRRPRPEQARGESPPPRRRPRAAPGGRRRAGRAHRRLGRRRLPRSVGGRQRDAEVERDRGAERPRPLPGRLLRLRVALPPGSGRRPLRDANVGPRRAVRAAVRRSARDDRIRGEARVAGRVEPLPRPPRPGTPLVPLPPPVPRVPPRRAGAARARARRELHERAAAWHESARPPEDAIPYARAAGDLDRAARLLGDVVLPQRSSGRSGGRRGAWLEAVRRRARLEQYPVVGVLGAWVHEVCGRSAAATAAPPPPKRGFGGSCRDGRLARALDRGGPTRQCRTASSGCGPTPSGRLRTLRRDQRRRRRPCCSGGSPSCLLGRTGVGDDSLAEAAETADASGAPRSAASRSPSGRCSRRRAATRRAPGCWPPRLATPSTRRSSATTPRAHSHSRSRPATGCAAATSCGRAWTLGASADRPARRLEPRPPLARGAGDLELARANVSLLDAPPPMRLAVRGADEVLRRRPRLGGLVRADQELLRRGRCDAGAEPGEGHARP